MGHLRTIHNRNMHGVSNIGRSKCTLPFETSIVGESGDGTLGCASLGFAIAPHPRALSFTFEQVHPASQDITLVAEMSDSTKISREGSYGKYSVPRWVVYTKVDSPVFSVASTVIADEILLIVSHLVHFTTHDIPAVGHVKEPVTGVNVKALPLPVPTGDDIRIGADGVGFGLLTAGVGARTAGDG